VFFLDDDGGEVITITTQEVTVLDPQELRFSPPNKQDDHKLIAASANTLEAEGESSTPNPCPTFSAGGRILTGFCITDTEITGL
jgi:hypothetical protein